MRIRLATKISATIVGVVVLAVISSTVAMLLAWQVGKTLAETTAENVPSVRAAEELESHLLEQEGLVRSYLLDNGNPAWLKELREREPEFQRWIAQIRDTTHVSEEEHEILLRLEAAYRELAAKREEVITLYQQGHAEKARTIFLSEVSNRLDRNAYDLCEEFIAANDRDVETLTAESEARIRLVTWLVGGAVAATIALAGVLIWFFYHDVIFPLRGMAADARLFRGGEQNHGVSSAQDELREVGENLRGLLSDFADTRSRLERSRARLLNAEKLASVGKLAASVAHEIRNPLAAMKMWLFSIRQAVQENSELEEKCGIVADEITRLESIVRHFLEFSRPAALKCRPVDMEGLVEHTLELVGPKIGQRGIRIVREPAGPLPPAMADGDQLKQVLLNLLNNAAEAMEDGGQIRVSAAAEHDADGRPMVVVRIRDTGSGMPEEVRTRIFEPFFTTKDEGTGLGLCIAAQIMARHSGLLVLESSNCQGTVFAIWTPVA
jgi:signal transduction histidine kinase